MVSRTKGQVLTLGIPAIYGVAGRRVPPGAMTGERAAREELVSRNPRKGLLRGGGSGW